MRPTFQDYWHYYIGEMTPLRWARLGGSIVLCVFFGALIWARGTFWADKTECGQANATVIQSDSSPRSSKWVELGPVVQQIVETEEGERFMLARPVLGLQIGDDVRIRQWCDADGQMLFSAGLVRE